MKEKKPAKVGQAIYDIITREQAPQEVGETLNEISPDYIEQVKQCIRDHCGLLESPFYVVVLGKKEQYALNVIRHWFVARQTCPSSHYLMERFPNCFHEIYKFNESTGDCHLVWCLPAQWAHNEIMNKPELYDKQLVEFVWDHYGNKLTGTSEI